MARFSRPAMMGVYQQAISFAMGVVRQPNLPPRVRPVPAFHGPVRLGRPLTNVWLAYTVFVNATSDLLLQSRSWRSGMKLDLLYELQPLPRPWARPHPYGQRDAEQKIYEDAFEQVELADRLGFQTAWFVEHHFRDGRSASATPEAVLGGLSRVTRDIRLGFGVTLMPFGFTHPARVAEKVATVDIMSRGRVEWGTGRSTPMEQVAFGVPIDERSKEQWREAVEIVVGMWERERFSWDSPNFHFPERVQTPKPFQDPHPPAWMAASSERSVDLAGSLGLGLLYFTLLQPLEKTREHIATYRAAVAPVVGSAHPDLE